MLKPTPYIVCIFCFFTNTAIAFDYIPYFQTTSYARYKMYSHDYDSALYYLKKAFQGAPFEFIHDHELSKFIIDSVTKKELKDIGRAVHN